MTLKQLKEIALYAAQKTAPANYTSESVNKAVADGFRELAGSVNQFMKNRYDIYEVIVEVADEIVPKKVSNALNAVADVKVVKQNEKATFKRKIGKMRAKKFLTQVGLSGVYETFRLDEQNLTIASHAVGGAAIIDFERLCDGSETLADVMEVITEGLTEAVFLEVQKALRAAFNATGRPQANKVTGTTFDGKKMQKLISVAKAYGSSAVIFAPPEFIAEMGADAIVPIGAGGNYGGVYSPDDIDAIHKTGRINLFRGTPVVEIPQSFVDENNEKTWIDPQLAYVLPGGNEKVVKVVLEGQTQLHDFVNRDNSIEIHAYRKLGVGILSHYNWCVYQNTGITQTYEG